VTELAVGVDIGGTSTRVLAVTPDGTVFGRGSAGGGNPNSHPTVLAAKRVSEAVAAALGDGGDVRACLLGMAGESKYTDPAVVETFESALRQVGVTCEVTVVSDAEVAFASATAEPDGTVLIGGTGSVAARIVARRKTSWCGGWGWLLGDEGSAYWIGREAVRSTLRALQSDRPLGALGHAVLTAAVGADLPLDDLSGRRAALSKLITAANAEAPIRLAGYAGTVSEHATTDPAATSIVDRAAELLAAHATAVRTADEHTPIVLAGSVIGPESPVGLAVREQLADEGAVLFAPDGAMGAAWLAALLAWGDDTPRPESVEV
jgi:N-acetylglucosamine kinase-like BadF-type ATPase